MVLRVLGDDRTWIVKYCQSRISSGWKIFASDNNLKVGDVCLFEMINYDAYAFRVLVFRVDDEQGSPPPQGKSSYFFLQKLHNTNGYTFHPLNQFTEIELIG